MRRPRTRRFGGGPVLEPPISVSGAAPPPVPPVVKSSMGLLLGALVGATAAYFVPKVWDRVLSGPEYETYPLDGDE